MSKLLANQIANYGDDAPIEIKEGLNIPAGKPIQAAGYAGSSGQVLTSTGSTIEWSTPFSGSYNDLTNRPTIPAAQVNSDWNATSGVSLILNKPVVPAQPSINTAAPGLAALSYNSTNGEFTFTPPDLSGYLTSYTETDPVFAASDAAAVTAAKITTWDTAYGWGNHATQNYATQAWVTANNFLTAEADTFQSVINRGNTSTSPVYVTNKVYFSNVFDTLTDLQAVNAATYHGMFAHAHDTGHGYFAHDGAWKQIVDTASSIDELGDVDTTTSAPQDGYVLKWEASSSSWKPAPDLVGTSNAGITLQDLSVNNAAPGATSLSYSNTTGVFTYTPPDLSGYLTSETDPVFVASPASTILSSMISNWETAYGWGNHATAGYASGTNEANWDTAYGWGDHSAAGYLTAEADTLSTVLSRGATTSGNDITFDQQGDKLIFTSSNFPASGGSIEIATNGANYATIAGNSKQLRIYNDTDNTYSIDMRAGTYSWKDESADYYALFNSGSCKLYHPASAGGILDQKLETTSTGVTITGALTAGGLTYPTSNGTNGQVLTSDGAGNVTWGAGGGGAGGANVTISDTSPGGASAGDLWWESDTGRLKIYYQDTDSSQWVDTTPPLSFENINGVVTANAFKFRLNESSPPSGTLGEIRQIDSKPHFYDGTNWQEFILASTEVATIPAETAWDNVIVRTNFDNDADDLRFGATGTLGGYFSSRTDPSRVASPVKFGTNSLNATGDPLSYPHRSEYDFTGEWTIEFWLYYDSFTVAGTNYTNPILGKGYKSDAGAWALYWTVDVNGNYRLKFGYDDEVGGSYLEKELEAHSGFSFGGEYLNVWNHMVLTRDNQGRLHFYRNGFESANTRTGSLYANNISNNSLDLFIGGTTGTNITFMDGYIDDVRITTDERYTSAGNTSNAAFTPPTTAHPISGATTTYTPPATSKAGEITLGTTPTWTGTLGVTVSQQTSGTYRMTFANAFTNATDYYVFANHMDYPGGQAVFVSTNRSAGYIDFVIYRDGDGNPVDLGSLAVQVIAH